jgi:transglutaminase/protease-like cytokinesis protein 3
MTPSDEASIESVAAYLVASESDPYQRIKALHDYVADRVAYDGPSYVAGRYPRQDARTVFSTHLAVCAGYANLFVAIGRAMHETVDFVGGDARKDGTQETGAPHAWNAVVIEGSSYLLDVTWDSGYLEGSTFTKRYQTSYFLTPPPVFGLDHFPEDSRWQLRGSPISRGDFFRQPMMSPEFYALGFELVSPDRSLVSVQGSLDIETRNTRGATMLASFAPRDAASDSDSLLHECRVKDGPTTSVHCDFPADGAYSVKLFASGERGAHRFPYVGAVEVNSAR